MLKIGEKHRNLRIYRIGDSHRRSEFLEILRILGTLGC